METASSSGRVLDLPAKTAAAVKAEVDAVSAAESGPEAQATPRKRRGRRAPTAAQSPNASATEAAAGKPAEPSGPLTPAQPKRSGGGGAETITAGGNRCCGVQPNSKAAVQAGAGNEGEGVAVAEAVQTVQALKRRRVRARRG